MVESPPSAYPLAWPAHKPRTPWNARAKGGFSGTRGEIMGRLVRQVELLGGRWLIVSSNMELRADGKPHLGRAEPSDPGIAIYFEMGGKPYTMACDRFDVLSQNAAAIANHIDATRRIERYGVATAAESLQAFTALPAPKKPHEVLGVVPNASRDDVQRAWRAKIAITHPDQTGSHEAAAEVNAARDAMLKDTRS